MKVGRQGLSLYRPGRIALSPDVQQAILHVVRAGWAVALKVAEGTGTVREEVLNELLRDGMRVAVERDRAEGRHRRLPEMSILDETASRSRPDVQRPDGRIDIPILLLTRPFAHVGHALIECKRIAGNRASLCRLYVVEGMDRFASGKYARNHAIAFMVGYVIAGTCVAAADGVNGYLQRQARPEDRLEQIPSPDKSTWQSRHSRTSGCPIVLLHTFLATRAS